VILPVGQEVGQLVGEPPRVEVAAVIRAKQALPGLSTAVENNMLVLDDLRGRLRTAMAIRDAEVRAAFTPRKLAVGARVDDVRVGG
jgi:hypothetical protein